MISENSKQEQDRRLEQRNYSANEDIFNQEEHISIDGDGKPTENPFPVDNSIDRGLDIPGIEYDDNLENVGSEDEENNYYSHRDQDDDHEEQNNDILT